MKKFLSTSLILLLIFSVCSPVLQAQFFPRIGHSGANFNYQGNWNVSTTYTANDAVRSPTNGQLYVATDSVTGGTDPGTSTTPPSPWASPFQGVIAQGPIGDPGANGTNGDGTVVYFRESATQPPITGETYIGGVFTPPAGFTQQIPNPFTNPIWAVVFRLDGDGTSYAQQGIVRFSGIDGERGTDGDDGADSIIPGPIGLTGNNGAVGDNGLSSQIIYRKTTNLDLVAAPSAIYDGTSLGLPTTDNNSWQLQPYVSREFASWALDSRNTMPADVDVDTSIQPNVVYVLDTSGFVYRYSVNGSFMSRWALDAANDTPIDLDVTGDYVRVLDGRNRGGALNNYNKVYRYAKVAGGLQTDDFRVPRGTARIAKTISVHENSIYIVTENAIRRFNLTGNEQTTGILNDLGSDNSNPNGSDINEYYFFIVDETDSKIYTREIEALGISRPTKEWNLSSNNQNPFGIGIADAEVFVVDLTSLRVYRYYNPDQPLWGSTIAFVPGTTGINQITLPFQMTGDRGEDTVTIQGTGVGQDGANGNSSRFVFREVGLTSPAPATPTGGSYSSGNYDTAPNDWHLTAAGALQAFSGVGTLYASTVTLSGDGSTILSYSPPFNISGSRGPPGTAAAAGNSVEFIYRPDTSEPNVPTGGTFIAATRTFTPPTGWTLNPPASISDSQNLYIVEAVLPGQGTDGGGTITYRHPTTIPRGPIGQTGPVSTTPGPMGRSFTMIFLESSTIPALPTGGSWDGRTFRAPTSWSENTPTRTVNDPENLYATGVELPSSGGTPHYTGIFQLNGNKGETGNTGLQGIRGDGSKWIFRIDTTTPPAPVAGSGTWNSETNTYTPPSGWSLDYGTYTGVQNLYGVEVKLPGSDNTEIYTGVAKLNGLQGTVGIRGPPGVPGGTTGSSEDGDSLSVIYKVSTMSQDPAIIGIRPTGGAWNHTTNSFTVPVTWLSDIPNPLNNRFVFMAVVILHGESNTISYHLPVQLNLKGEKGDTGNTGGIGATGARGASQGFIYQRALSKPDKPVDGTGQFFASTNTVVVSPWSDDPDAGTGLLYASAWSYNSEASPNLTYSNTMQLEGETGQKGDRGERGNDGSGTGGNDGDSTTFMFTASSSNLRTPPTGGTWVRSTHTFTPPSNWYTTYIAAEMAGSTGDIIYNAAVYLSGTTDSVLAYSHPIRMTGPRGPPGPKGDSITGPIGPKGDSIVGPPGRDSTVPGPDGRFYIPLFLWSSTRPTSPSPTTWDGNTIQGVFDWSRAPAETGSTGQNLWEALIQVEPANNNNASFVTLTKISGPPSTVPGPDGNSLDVIYQRSSSVPSLPTGGTWNGNDYDPPAGWFETLPSGTNPLYASIVKTSGSDQTNTGISYSDVIDLNGQRGLPGVAGSNAPPIEIQYSVDNSTYANNVTNPYFIRYSVDGGTTWLAGKRFRQDGTNGTNAPNIRIQYSVTGSTGTYRDSVTNPYFIRYSVDNGTTWLAGERFRQDGTNGLPGQSLVVIYMSSATIPANPGPGTLVTAADPATYTPPTNWSVNVPTRVTTADIYQAHVTLHRTGTTPSITRALFLEPRLPTSPVSPSTQSFNLNYGLTNPSPNYVISSTTTSNSIDLASGAQGNFDFTTPTTTDANPNFYFDLPAGLTLVKVQSRQGGQYFDDSGWTVDDSSQPRRYINDSSYSGNFKIVRVIVRRN